MTNGTGKSDLIELAEFLDLRNSAIGIFIHSAIATLVCVYCIMVFQGSPKIETQYMLAVELAIFGVLYFSYLLAVKHFYDWILPSRRDAI